MPGGTCWRATPRAARWWSWTTGCGSRTARLHLFVQNGELHTHGVGAPDLGLGAHRNAVIVNALVGREVYAVRERNVFQSFGVRAAADRSALSWERANRELIAKLLTELEFEELLQPDVDGRRVDADAGPGSRCTTPRGGARWATRAWTRTRCARPRTASRSRCRTRT